MLLNWAIGILLIVVATPTIISAQAGSKKIMMPEDRHSMNIERAQETAQVFESHIYKNAKNDTLLYRLLKPLNYDPLIKYPLVVCLSGTGGRGADNTKQIGDCWASQILATQENREAFPSFVLVPQCPSGSNWGISANERSRKGWERAIGKASVDSRVFALMAELEREFNIDANRRYVTGQSMGGMGTWHFILTHPDTFAAAIPISGASHPDLAKTIVHVPVWAFHGGKDKRVSVKGSRKMIDAIKVAGGSPRYTEFPDAGHICWPLAFDTPGLLDWLFSQQRESE